MRWDQQTLARRVPDARHLDDALGVQDWVNLASYQVLARFGGVCASTETVPLGRSLDELLTGHEAFASSHTEGWADDPRLLERVNPHNIQPWVLGGVPGSRFWSEAVLALDGWLTGGALKDGLRARSAQFMIGAAREPSAAR